MPFRFREYTKKKKGILILKHSEFATFSKFDNRFKLRVKDKYYLGIYFGFAMNLTNGWGEGLIDFVVAADNVANGLNSSIPRIPLNGFNFIAPAEERYTDGILNKVYDFIFVGNSQTRKNLYKLVCSISELDAQGKNYTYILINRVGLTLEEKINARRIRKKINSLSDYARSRVTYIEFNGSQDQLPKSLLFLAMRQSKALICPSRSEGAARIVAEASLRGLNVISYKFMKGGTNNFLDKDYDLIFDDFNSLSSVMDKYVENADFYLKKDIACQTIYEESHSKLKFVDYLSNILSEPSEELAQIASKLDMKNALSSHTNLLPSNCSSKTSDEALKSSSMLRYFENICGFGISTKMQLSAYFQDLINAQILRLRRVANLLKFFVH